MKKFLKKYQTWFFPGAILLMLVGVFLAWSGLNRPIKIILDGEETVVRTSSLSIPGIFRSAGINPDDEDRVLTNTDGSILGVNTIFVERAREIWIKTPNDEVVQVTTETMPANLLQSLGIDLYPDDQVLVNGVVVDPYLPMGEDEPILMQYRPAEALTVIMDGEEHLIYTNEITLGAALEEEAISLAPEDWISEPLTTPVNDIGEVTIRRAKPIKVQVDNTSVDGLTSAETVGDVLKDIGQPLQNLDYSIPPADAPVPEDRQIGIVRVNEDLMLTMDETPFENERVEDPNAMLDTISVVEPGQMGIYATRERIRYEDGEEVWRSPTESWQASQAKDGVLGYGTRVEVRTEVVDGQTIEYWRKITVYATSYSPCRSGIDGCSYGTATGILPVQKGVVAVTPRWLSVPNGYGMWGQSVYIPGYGRAVIADSGGGIPGTPWIDLAYSDEEYVSWNRWTTMYFLTPVPDYVAPIIMP
ncbi:MAG: ubiquitin-like domain-containing protein [Chloroflexota bacterium]|nr:ubiquitin-like domain-containing protein [Chloroflexota bacterium]